MKSVLVISIALSNGGTVIFEISENGYSQHIRFIDNDGILHNSLLIERLDEELIYDFDLEQDTRNCMKKNSDHSDELFLKAISNSNIKMEYINGYNLYIYSIKLINDISLSHFFIEAPELDQINNLGDFYSLSLIDNNKLLVYSDSFLPSHLFSVKPIEVSIELKTEFSKFVIDKTFKLNE